MLELCEHSAFTIATNQPDMGVNMGVKSTFDSEYFLSRVKRRLDPRTSGTSRQDVLNGFIYATEFATLCYEYGISATKVSAFVRRFYQQCLNREPDLAGLTGWVNELVGGIEMGADVAYGFVFSQEFINRGTTNGDYLTVLYRAFFNREPDTAGYDSWLSLLDSGTDRQEILNGFIYAQEFVNLCNNYGIVAFESQPPGDETTATCGSGQVNLQPKIEGSLTDLTCKITTTCEGPLDGIVCFEGGNESQCETNILDTGTSSSIHLSNITSTYALDFILPDGVEKVNFLYCDSGTISITTPRTCSDGSAPNTMTAPATNCTESFNAIYTGDFSGSTTQTLYLGIGDPCIWLHSFSGTGTATVSGSGSPDNPYTATFAFTGSDVITTQTWPECGNDVVSGTYTGSATISPDGTIEAHMAIGDGTGDFVGSVSADGNSVTGTLTIDNPVFDSPIVGPLTLIRQH